MRESFIQQFRPRDRRTIYEWARDNVSLSPPLTKTGPFDVSISRHFIAPLDALQDDRVREVNVLKPVRGGGTLIADVWCSHVRANDPGPFIFVLQTDPLADDHATKILLPTLLSVSSIRAMVEALGRHEKTGRKIEFADGNHLHINGPSIGNLQGNGFRYLVMDECWLYDAGRMGDALGRVGDYLRDQLSKVLRVSQGGCRDDRTLPECEWHAAYHGAEINEWLVQCLSCGHFMQPILSGTRPDGSFWGLVWDKHKLPGGDWDIPKCLPTVRFECERCAHPMIDGPRLKAEWNRTGKYQTAADANVLKKSFHWSALIADSHADLCDLWLQACNAQHRGNLVPKLQWYQKRGAEHMDEERLLRGGSSLKRVAYEINADWPEEKLRFLHVDCQAQGIFWWTVRACSGAKTRRLGFGKAYSYSELVGITEQFKIPTFVSTSKTSRHPYSQVTIDSRYNPTGPQGVYAACIRYGWIAFQGDQKLSFTHFTMRNGQRETVERSYSEVKRGDPDCTIDGRKLLAVRIQFSKSRMNSLVQQLRDNGSWEDPIADPGDEMEKEYSVQMSGRSKRVEFSRKTGLMQEFYKETQNDHALDLGNQHACCMVIQDQIPDPITEQAVSVK